MSVLVGFMVLWVSGVADGVAVGVDGSVDVDGTQELGELECSYRHSPTAKATFPSLATTI